MCESFSSSLNCACLPACLILPADVAKFLRMLTFLPLEEVAALEAAMQVHLGVFSMACVCMACWHCLPSRPGSKQA